MSNRFKIKPVKNKYGLPGGQRTKNLLESLRKEECPTCGARIGEVFEVNGVPVEEGEVGCACTMCDWECLVGGNMGIKES